MLFTKENIPFLKGLLKKTDPKAAMCLDTVKKGGVIDAESADYTIISVLATMPDYDVTSIAAVLGHPVTDLAEFEARTAKTRAAKQKAEKQRKIDEAQEAATKANEKEIARVAREAKAQKKAEAQKRKEEAQRLQNESRKAKTIFTTSGLQVDDITTIIPKVTNWLSTNDSVYLSGGLLARWSDSNEAMVILNENNFGSLLGMGFSFKKVRYTAEGEVDEFLALCPQEIQKSILGTAYFHNVRSVDALLRHPVVSELGEVIGQKKGYNAQYKLLFAEDTELHEVDVETAYRDLFDVFHEFPQKAIPGALATLFTLLTRVMLPTAPMICMDAPTVSSGKSLLARCCIKIICGESVSSRSQEASDEEFDKNLKSYIQSNPGQTLFLDDFDGFIKYNVLKTLLTEPDRYSFRILGTPKSCAARTNFTIILTGNHIQLSIDLTRRSIIVNLDTGIENPSHRKTKRTSDQLQSYCISNRNHLLSCTVAILRDAIANASDAHQTRVMGTFEKWADVVGKSTVYATEKLKSMGLLSSEVEGDVTPDMAKFSQMSNGAGDAFADIYERMQDKSWKIQDLPKECLKSLDSLLGIGKDSDNDISRGIRLRKHKDIPRTSEGHTYVLRQLTNRKWRIVEMIDGIEVETRLDNIMPF
jgi:hypothetical protein